MFFSLLLVILLEFLFWRFGNSFLVFLPLFLVLLGVFPFSRRLFIGLLILLHGKNRGLQMEGPFKQVLIRKNMFCEKVFHGKGPNFVYLKSLHVQKGT